MFRDTPFHGISRTFITTQEIHQYSGSDLGCGSTNFFRLFCLSSPLWNQALPFPERLHQVVIDSSFQGTQFLFGRLAIAPGKEGSLGFILAFQALPPIIFFTALMEFLYYIGIMEKIISVFARVFVKIIGERIIETEVKPYQDLALLIKEGKIMYERSVVIATYALCGFATHTFPCDFYRRNSKHRSRKDKRYICTWTLGPISL